MTDAFGKWEWDRLAGGSSSVVARGAGASLYEPFAVQARSVFVDHVIPLLSPGSIIEVGCGKGQWLEIMKSRGLEVTGGDRSEQMVEQARRIEASVTRFDAASIPHPDRWFTTALTVTVLQHNAEARPAIAELARIADKRIIIHEMTRSWVPSRFSTGTTARSVGWYEEAFAAHGFDLVRDLTRETPRPRPGEITRLMPRGRAAAAWLPRAAGLYAAAHHWLVFDRRTT